jgi:serine phosphatase RsbU (regulator of sigma subunit)
MSKQLHTRFTTPEVVDILERYLSQEINVEIAQRLLAIKRRRFFILLKNYSQDPDNFSVEYSRHKANYTVDQSVEEKIITALNKDKALILNKDNPVRTYNYSYIQTCLKEQENIKVSLPTIIRRAKKTIATLRDLKRKRMTVRCLPIM